MSSVTPAILAIDPASRRTGWAVANLETGGPLGCGSVDVTGLGAAVREALRTMEVHANARNADIHLIYVEGTFGGGRSARSGAIVAEAAGQLIQACSRRWPDAPIERLAPAEWKALIGINGNADYDTYTRRVIELGWPVPLTGKATLRHDVDAAAAAGIATAAHIRNIDILAQAGAT